MTHDTRIALFLMGVLVASLRANDPGLFKRWLVGGVVDLGKPAVTELLLEWLAPRLNATGSWLATWGRACSWIGG